MQRIFLCLLTAVLLCVWTDHRVWAQSAVPRSGSASGAVISRASGETIRFAGESAFQPLATGQSLVAGDVIRTGPDGAVGILFVDRTTMRLHPNSELVIKTVTTSQTDLELTSGKVWARTPRNAGGAVSVDTPSAAAAIRGTDWTLSVVSSRETSLYVFEGAAELSNAQGTASATSGNAVSAQAGQAPRSVQVAQLSERQQMLLTFSPSAQASALTRVLQSTTSDPIDPRFFEALGLLAQGAFVQAAEELEAALPGFDRETRAAARWIAVLARAEAGENVRPPRARGTVMDAFGASKFAAYVGNFERAAEALAPVMQRSEALADAVALAVYRDRFDEAKALLSDLLVLDPDGAASLAAQALVARIIDGDPQRAMTLLRRAVRVSPSDTALWNALAVVEADVDHPVEALAAVEAGLALAPGDPVLLANLVARLLDGQQLRAAEAALDRLEAVAPKSFTTFFAQARVALQAGDADRARDLALEALAAQPAAAVTSRLLATASYDAGNVDRADQELEAAARLDPNDPNVPILQAITAIEEARPEEAIRAARQAEELFRKNYAAEELGANRRSGSTRAAAYNNMGLDDWARDITERGFDPLSAASLFSEGLTPRFTISGLDQASDRRDSFINGSVVQGVLLDPLGVATPLGRRSPVLTPFFDAELYVQGGGGDSTSTTRELVTSGYTNSPLPLAHFFQASEAAQDRERLNDSAANSSFFGLVGAQPTSQLGLFLLANDLTYHEEFPGPVAAPSTEDNIKGSLKELGLGLTYRFRERDVLTFYANRLTDKNETFTLLDEFYDPFVYFDPFFGFIGDDVRHTVTFEDRYQEDFVGLGLRSDSPSGAWLLGAEYYAEQSRSVELDSYRLVGSGIDDVIRQVRESEESGTRLYVQRRQNVGGALDLQVAAGLFHIDIDGADQSPYAPRLGFAANIAPHHRVRAAAVREISLGESTLSPISTLGLVPIQAPQILGGETEAVILRYDGEFGDTTHLSFEHQNLRYTDLFFSDGDPFGGFSIDKARLKRTEVRAEALLGRGFAGFAALAFADSSIENGPFAGRGIPTVPDREASLGLNWVGSNQMRASTRLRYVGAREAGFDLPKLDPVTLVDASFSWEMFDKQLDVSLEVQNLLNADFQRAFDLGSEGRRLQLSAAVRF